MNGTRSATPSLPARKPVIDATPTKWQNGKDRMDREKPDQWDIGEQKAVSVLRELFRKWRDGQIRGEFGVMVTSEGARGPQTCSPVESPSQQIR